MQTFLLSTDSWDLTIDSDRNIAVASDPYSQAQDAASAINTFQGECYYNVNLGIPYWSNVLGFTPSLALMKSYFTTMALLVPGTATAVCYINSFVNRKVSGQVQITNTAGQNSVAGF